MQGSDNFSYSHGDLAPRIFGGFFDISSNWNRDEGNSIAATIHDLLYRSQERLNTCGPACVKRIREILNGKATKISDSELLNMIDDNSIMMKIARLFKGENNKLRGGYNTGDRIGTYPEKIYNFLQKINLSEMHDIQMYNYLQSIHFYNHFQTIKTPVLTLILEDDHRNPHNDLQEYGGNTGLHFVVILGCEIINGKIIFHLYNPHGKLFSLWEDEFMKRLHFDPALRMKFRDKFAQFFGFVKPGTAIFFKPKDI